MPNKVSNKQLKLIIKMIIEILKSAETKEEAIKKIEELSETL